MVRPTRTTLAFVAVLALPLCAFTKCTQKGAVRWQETGVVDTPLVDEASGLAPSRRDDNLYWVHNDSGNERLVIALDGRGRHVGTVKPEGLPNQHDMDWEDLASFEWQGRPFLLVADVGDNDTVRPRVLVHVLQEPARASLSPNRELSVPVAWTQELHYPAGSRDCESVAVDPVEGKIYLLTKREFPAVVYSAPLGPQTGPVTLTAVGRCDTLPQPDRWQATVPAPRGKFYGQPTGMDFSADGKWAVVLTYGNTVFYRRHGTENWGVTLSRPPERIGPHLIAQAEAVCFERRSLTVRAMGEGEHPTFYRGTWKAPVSEQ